MGLNIRPDYRVIANRQDITDTIRDRFKSLRLTDEAGSTSDTLELTLADHIPDRPIAVPPTGAELEVSIGYDGVVRQMGLFVVDEIELSGPPNEVVIRARAAPYTSSTGGKSDLQTQKTRSWKAGTTVGALVRKIASEHGLEPVVSSSLASIRLPHTDQSSESDMNLLVRLAKRYDAIAKPGGGRLMFVVRGASQTASGSSMQAITLAPGDVSSWRVTQTKRNGAGTVVAYYRSVGEAKRKEISVGSGDPVRRLRMGYKDQDSARAAAEAEQRMRARSSNSLAVEMPGNPDLVAEATVTMEGFREGVDGEWLAKRVEHYIGSRGYRTNVEGERPNSNKDVEASGGDVKEADQAGTEEGD